MAATARMQAFGVLIRRGNRALQNPASGFFAARKMECLSLSSSSRRYDPVCGCKSITDINNPQVTEIANFAVTEYRKQSDAKLLKLVRVVRGEKQPVAGLNYRLVFEAEDGTATRTYEAVVYDRPWQNLKELLEFNLRNG